VGTEIHYAESRLRDGTRLVTLRGELDVYAASAELEELLAECMESACHLLLDMSQVGFIDSTVIALLVRVQRGLSASRRRLVLLNPSANVRRLLELTGLDQRLVLAASWPEAEMLLDEPLPRGGGHR